MKTSSLLPLALLFAFSCATTESSHSRESTLISFDVGAAEFPYGDLIVVEEVHSSTGQIASGAEITVRGRYELRSRNKATLYLGVTAKTSGASAPADTRQQTNATLGSSSFELSYVVPGPGYPHVTFYDTSTGKPFGGVYFGKDETLLRTKSWTNSK